MHAPPVSSSYVSGTSDRPLVYRTVDEVLRGAAMEMPEHRAVVAVHQEISYSFAEFDREVERTAQGMAACGLRPGERIGIWSPNRVEWLLTLFAAARAGLILVNINPAFRSAELEFALRHVGCAALVFAPRFKASDYSQMLSTLLPELAHFPPGRLSCPSFPALRLLIDMGERPLPGAISFGALMALGDAPTATALPGRIEADEIFNIQFTSGTTGTPKGAALTHFNIVNNGFFVGEGMRLTPEDRVCIPVPLYHCFGMVLGVLAAMTHGAASILPSEGFDAESVLNAVSRLRCTALHGVPTMFIAELEHPRFREFDLSSLRTGIMAGSPCPTAVMRRVVQEMHMPEVTICYGMTETSPVSFQTHPDDALERRVSTVGRVHPLTELERIRPVTGSEADLREALTNLIFNAVDAMPQGGTITVCTHTSNSRIIMEVADTGTGMTEEVRQRCLEPFFTTKGDRGTGLGLSMVYGILQRHQGTVEIETTLGKGTTFRLSLPGRARKSPRPANATPRRRASVRCMCCWLMTKKSCARFSASIWSGTNTRLRPRRTGTKRWTSCRKPPSTS